MNLRIAMFLALAPLSALAQGNCDAELEDIDRRIESGDYPPMNVELAKQMRASFAQMCGMLDEATRAQMMQGIEEVLPTKSAAEQEAEQEAKRVAAEASRAERKAKQAAQQSTAGSLASSVSQSGRSVASGFVERAEDMLHFWVWDWDVYQGKARVLYTTLPSRTQLGRPDWQQYVYVAEIDKSGRATQHLVASKQAQDHAALALRRGHDEIIFERHGASTAAPRSLERWSVSGRKLASTVPAPNPAWDDGEMRQWRPFGAATSDGNALFISTYQPAGEPLSLSWFEASPVNGAVLGRGSAPLRDGGVTSPSLIRTYNGGAAIALLVNQEKRILTIEDDARGSRLSGAIESFSMPASLEEVRELDRAPKPAVSNDIGPHSVDMIQPVGSQYVVLTRRPALLRVGDDSIDARVSLESLANELDVGFRFMTTNNKGEIFLYGDSETFSGTDYVVMLDSSGAPQAIAEARQPKNGKIEGMLADDDGVWLFGNGYPTGEFSWFRFWSERIDIR